MKITRRATRPARIEMLPLIDIVFLLLVFFIYAMLSMAVHRGLQLDLPESSAAQQSRKSEFSLFVRRGPDSTLLYSLNEQPVSTEQLTGLLQNCRTDPKPPEMLVFAEKDISYQQLYHALDLLQENGCSNISLQSASD